MTLPRAPRLVCPCLSTVATPGNVRLWNTAPQGPRQVHQGGIGPLGPSTWPLAVPKRGPATRPKGGIYHACVGFDRLVRDATRPWQPLIGAHCPFPGLRAWARDCPSPAHPLGTKMHSTPLHSPPSRPLDGRGSRGWIRPSSFRGRVVSCSLVCPCNPDGVINKAHRVASEQASIHSLVCGALAVFRFEEPRTRYAERHVTDSVPVSRSQG